MNVTSHIRHFVTLDELASRLALPRTWLRELANAGTIPTVRAGRRRVFDLEEVRTAIVALAKRGGKA